MPLTLICRRCSSEVFFQDVFCQECGLTQPVKNRPELEPGSQPGSAGFQPASKSSGLIHTDFDWPALDPDPLGFTPPDNPAITGLFGETYDFSNYQVDLSNSTLESEENEISAEKQEDVSTIQDSLIEPHSVAGGATSAEGSLNEVPSQAESTTRQTQAATIEQVSEFEDGWKPTLPGKQRLHSPLFDEPTKHPIADNGLGMRGGFMMVLLDNAIVFALVCFVAVLSLFAVKLYQKTEHTKSSQQARIVSDKVKAAAIKEDYEGIHQQLGTLIAEGKSDLVERQQALFDEAVFRLGEKELSAGNPARAIDYLKQVSVDSDHYVRARELIFQHATARFAKAEPQEAPKRSRKRQRRFAASNENLSGGASAQSARVSLDENPVLSIPVIPELEKLNSEATADGETAEQSAAKAATRKFSESEISQYNHHLANYFAKHGKKSKDETAEVPSFREWLKQGKPGF